MPTFREDVHLGHEVALWETDDIKDKAVTTEKLDDGAITNDKIADEAVTTEKIADGSVTGEKIQDKALTPEQFSDEFEVTERMIADQAITTDKIADDAVTTPKILDGAVTSDKIPDGDITTEKIANEAVTTEKIPDGDVTTEKLANGAVTTPKMPDGAITTEKIANEGVTEEKLAPGAVTTDKLAPEVISELETITDAEPTPGSVKPVQSGGVESAIRNLVKGIGNYSTGAPDYNPLISDANDAEVNRIYSIEKANYVANIPSDGQGILVTFSYSLSATFSLCQIFISAATSELYWRIKFGSNWDNWKGTDSFALLAKTILTNNNKITASYNPFTDADNAPNNSVWCIQAANVVSNMPTSDQQGLLITLQSDSSNSAVGRLQICMNADGELYYRNTWGGDFGNWKRIDFPEGSDKIIKNLEDLNYNIIDSVHGTLVDYTECIDNKYLNSNGSYGDSDEFMISNYIPVNTGIKLYFTNCGNNVVCIYDKNKNYLSYLTVPNLSGVEITNANWAYIRFNIGKVNIPNGLFVSYNENDHLYGLAYGQKGYPHNMIVDFDQAARNALRTEENITLGTTYATLKEALDYASTVANANKIVNILVPAGEYNVFSDIDLASQTSEFKGLIVPDYVNIIGLGAAKDTILKADLPVDMTGYAFSRGNVSTLNLWRNNNLKNLTIIGSNMRYAVHNDTAAGSAGYVDDVKELFENCTFIGKQTDSSVNVDSSFGSGMKNGAELTFKNCKFIIESVATESTGVTFATNFHNTSGSEKTITWRFENCLFSSGYKNFAIYVTNYSGVKNGVIILNGCKIDKRICAASQTGSRDSDFIYYGTGNAFADARIFYGYGVDLTTEDTEMLI